VRKATPRKEQKDVELDRRAQENVEELFEDFLSFAEQVERESSERCAKSGEKPITVLIGMDWQHRRIAIVPIDGSPGSEGDQARKRLEE
jgi:hypothetical protein